MTRRGQRLEPPGVLGQHRVVDDHRGVLVGGQRLLEPGPRPERHPAVRHRRGPSSASASAMSRRSTASPTAVDDATDVVGGGVLLDERLHDPRQPPRHRGHPGDVRLLRDVAGEVDRVGLLEPEQVPSW